MYTEIKENVIIALIVSLLGSFERLKQEVSLGGRDISSPPWFHPIPQISVCQGTTTQVWGSTGVVITMFECTKQTVAPTQSNFINKKPLEKGITVPALHFWDLWSFWVKWMITSQQQHLAQKSSCTFLHFYTVDMVPRSEKTAIFY